MQKKSHINWGAVGQVYIGTICIGFAPIFARLARTYGEIGPISIAFWRVFIASIVLSGLIYLFRSRHLLAPHHDVVKPKLSFKLILLFLAPGFFFAGDLASWHWSFEFTTVLNATLLANLATIFVALIGWLFLHERLKLIFPIGAAIAFGGMVVLITSTETFTGMGERSIVGDLLGIQTALFYAGYILSIKLLRRHFSTLWIMFTASVCASFFLLIAAVINQEALWPKSYEAWLVLIALGIISHVGGQGLLTLSLRVLPASIASILLLHQPVATAVLGWIILGETLVLGQYFGAMLVLIGLYLAVRGKGEENELPKPI